MSDNQETTGWIVLGSWVPLHLTKPPHQTRSGSYRWRRARSTTFSGVILCTDSLPCVWQQLRPFKKNVVNRLGTSCAPIVNKSWTTVRVAGNIEACTRPADTTHTLVVVSDPLNPDSSAPGLGKTDPLVESSGRRVLGIHRQRNAKQTEFFRAAQRPPHHRFGDALTTGGR